VKKPSFIDMIKKLLFRIPWGCTCWGLLRVILEQCSALGQNFTKEPFARILFDPIRREKNWKFNIFRGNFLNPNPNHRWLTRLKLQKIDPTPGQKFLTWTHHYSHSRHRNQCCLREMINQGKSVCQFCIPFSQSATI